MKIRIIAFSLFITALATFFIGCVNAAKRADDSRDSDSESHIQAASEITIANAPPISDSLPDSTYSSDKNEAERLTSANLDEWLGKYEYIYNTNFDAMESNSAEPKYIAPKSFYHELLICKEKNQYYATYSVEGWLTYFVLSATVQADSFEMYILYESTIDGIYLSETETLKKGDLILQLKMNEDGTLSIIQENNDVAEAIFRLIEK